MSSSTSGAKLGLLDKYRAFLPGLTDSTPVVTLQEGGTPLIRAQNLERHLGTLRRETQGGGTVPFEVHLKYDGGNPTGSFKDRGMTMAMSKAVEDGTRGVVCASTGNTSASAAAYAARANVPCYVVIPQGKIALGKLSQAVMHGARVIEIRGNFDQALKMVCEVSEKAGITLVNSINPHRIAGQMTASWEIVDALGEAPDYHFIPVGNAGNITAHWRGYNLYLERGCSSSLPRMMGFQAAGSAPIVDGAPVENPETLATAIRIGNPASWQGATDARDESGGVIEKVTDEEIVAAYKLIASLEGVFAEPASAASVAGLIKSWAGGVDLSGRVVCTLTGHGLKDPNTAIDKSDIQPTVVDPTYEAVAAEIASDGSN